MKSFAFYKNVNYEAEGRSAITNKTADGKEISRAETVFALAEKKAG